MPLFRVIQKLEKVRKMKICGLNQKCRQQYVVFTKGGNEAGFLFENSINSRTTFSNCKCVKILTDNLFL